VADDAVWLDLRCLDEADEGTFAQQWQQLENTP